MNWDQVKGDWKHLVRIATEVMIERGLEPVLPPAVDRQLATIVGPAHDAGTNIDDLRSLALVLDRQRRFARPRPAFGRRGADRRRDGSWWPSPTSMRW